MVCSAENFNPIAEAKKPILRLQCVREGIAALFNLLLSGLLVSLLIDRRLVGAAALEEKCDTEEKEQGYFHEAKIARSRVHAKATPKVKAANHLSPNECYSDIFAAADERFSASGLSAPVLWPFALCCLFASRCNSPR